MSAISDPATSTPSPTRSTLVIKLAAIAVVGAATSQASAAPLYFDVNGASGGSGAVNAASYSWNSADNALWNTDSAGGAGTISGFTSGDSAVFAAGTDATGVYTVAVGAYNASPSSSQLGPVAGITIEEGNWTFNSNPVRLSAGSLVQVNSGASASFASQGIRPVASGTYTFENNGSSVLSLGSVVRHTSGINAAVVFAGTGDLSGSIANIGTGNITKNGAGTLTVSSRGNATSSQIVTVNGGTLFFNSTGTGGDSLTTSTSASAVRLSNNATLQTVTRTGVGGALSGIRLENTAGGTLRVEGSNVFTVDGAISEVSAGSQLSKTGTGTVVLANTNTYTGPTTVSNGTLLVDGSIGAGAVTVASIATLGGIGTVNGATTVNGTLAPGNSIGTLNFASSLALAGTTLMEIDKDPSLVADRVNGTTVALGGTLTVVDLDSNIATYAEGDSWNLFDGTLTGAFSAFNLPDVSGLGLLWDKSELSAGGDGTLTLAVPEPATLGLLAFGGLMLGRRRR